MDLIFLLGCGCAAGVTTVLFGFGGGFVAVPVVASFDVASGPAAMRVATATAAAVMAVSALAATAGARRVGLVDLRDVAPLLLPIALGACGGALAARVVPGGTVRLLFTAYLLATIADLLLRPGFLRPSRSEPPAGGRGGGRRGGGRRRAALRTGGAVGVGGVASLLGVGGSVMTVPALRRRGHSMARAAALANPLTLAVTAPALAIAAAGPDAAAIPRPHLGCVDLVAAAALLAGALPAIAFLRRRVRAIPDRLHAISYLALLLASAAWTVAPLVV